MALHLDDSNAVLFVGDDDVHLIVTVTGESDIGKHIPPIGQSVAERVDHIAFGIVA